MIFITFTFMHLADAFIQRDLQLHSSYTFFISMCVPWESNPQPFALLTQCSTTEPHRNTYNVYILKKMSVNRNLRPLINNIKNRVWSPKIKIANKVIIASIKMIWIDKHFKVIFPNNPSAIIPHGSHRGSVPSNLPYSCYTNRWIHW